MEPYNYQRQKQNLFTESGSVLFMKIRDNVQKLLKQSGAVRWQEGVAGCSGDTWDMLACFDRLVELGEVREITQADCPGQYRVFVDAK